MRATTFEANVRTARAGLDPPGPFERPNQLDTADNRKLLLHVKDEAAEGDRAVETG